MTSVRRAGAQTRQQPEVRSPKPSLRCKPMEKDYEKAEEPRISKTLKKELVSFHIRISRMRHARLADGGKQNQSLRIETVISDLPQRTAQLDIRYLSRYFCISDSIATFVSFI